MPCSSALSMPSGSRVEAPSGRSEHGSTGSFAVTNSVAGARRLPPHHVTIRVPWHDAGWTGTVCARPLDNSSCLILRRIAEGRRDEIETRYAGRRLDELDRADLPPCVSERVSFMAPFRLTRTMAYPYREYYPETHGQVATTRFVQSPCQEWRDRGRRTSEDRLGPGPRARHPQSSG